jgi:hypothetical protein
VGVPSAASAAPPPGAEDAWLDREAAERVLRRAVELDDLSPAGRDVSERALLEAADELGIDGDDLRRAIAEERLGLLTDHHRRGDGVLGPDRFLAVRVLDGRPERGRGLRRVRRAEGWSEYARRSDPVAAAQRAARKVQGKERLAHVRRLRVLVADAGARRALVGLVVDASTSRTAAAAGGGAVAASGVATAGATVAAGLPPVAWIWVPVAAVTGAGVVAARRSYVSDIGIELESVLDAIASGAAPASVLDDVAARLLRSQRA